MNILLALVGVVVGVSFFHGTSSVGAALFGAALGYLLGETMQLRRRISGIEAVQAADAAQTNLAPPAKTSTAESPRVPDPVPATPRAASAPPPIMPWKTAPVPAAPAEPSLLWLRLREWFSGPQAIPRVGVIVLFFGVAFLLKYAADKGVFPIELRLFGAALGAIVLLVVGWRLRARRQAYALVLQGGAVGVLYLTVFSALRFYSLLPAPLAFVLLAAIGAFAGALAVMQNSRALAVLAAAGGFLAPVLASTGGGQHVILFSYYALLNLGILGIAWFRSWRELNLLGFAFTFVIGTLWGARSYRPELFASTEPFLILFFVFYVAIAVLYALRQPPNLRGYVDATLVFGVPVVGFALQAALVRDVEFGLAWSAAGVGAFYIVLASVLWRWHSTSLRLLCESFLALGVVFATLALPLALDGRWTSAAWALEGAAMVWVGVRQQRLSARLFGALLIGGAGISFLGSVSAPADSRFVFNGYYLGTLMIALAALYAARQLQRREIGLRAWESGLGAVLFAWGLIWWIGGGAGEVTRHGLASGFELDLLIAFAAMSALLAELSGRRADWAPLRATARALLPAGLLFALASVPLKDHPFTPTGASAWALLLLVHFGLLRDIPVLLPPWIRAFLHGASVWLIALLGSLELAWWARQITSGEAWPIAAFGLVWALAAFAAAQWRLPRLWQTQHDAWRNLGALPVLAVAGLWLLAANLGSAGASAPLPYVPLLNPLDLVSAFVLMVAAQRILSARTWTREQNVIAWSVLGGLGFLWLNAALLRGLHHGTGVAFARHALFNSMLVQAALSIFWTVLAFVAMWCARRWRLRPLWMVGAALLVVVVLKLFLVDLARTGTLERIVSFIVVGVLLLLIGYLAPIPPSQPKQEKNS